ncbi:MAG TPA: alpha/beta fold hydrolase [Pseudoxanthomonas sp.]
MIVDRNSRRTGALACALLALALLNGCAVVKVREQRASDADLARRADVLGGGRLSADAASSLASAGLDPESCRREPEPCAGQLRQAVPEETWLATIAEVRTLRMQAAAEAMRTAPEVAAHEAMDTARWAYAYLFMTARTPEQRVFESRQGRVLRLYNRAVEVTAQSLFELARARKSAPDQTQQVHNLRLRIALHGFDRKQDDTPEMLLASDTLGFDNLRAVYGRDGFGSSLVAVFPPLKATATTATTAETAPSDPPYRDTRYLPVTSTLRFEGETLGQVLATEEVQIDVYNPYRYEQETIAGRSVPLAANFSAAYGVWLARSKLAHLSLSSLLRPRQQSPFDPRVYLTQPYDPDKRVVILVHGLASSPEAWVNLANELLGDNELRRHYQVWQVFYPTNLSILTSRQRIDRALRETFAHFDPEGDDRASHDAVLVGHSMGGVIARLLVSDSGEYVLQHALQSFPPAQAAALAQEPIVRELTVFHPLPEVGRAVFLASPHRGAEVSEGWALRLVRRMIRLPFTVLRDTSELFQRNKIDEQELKRIGFQKGRPPTGPDDLSPGSLFMRSTADLPIEAGLPYHSIVGWHDPSVPLAQSSDGLVPYASSHLDGALSEKAIPSGHSVQETPGAILELRRILRLEIATDDR